MDLSNGNITTEAYSKLQSHKYDNLRKDELFQMSLERRQLRMAQSVQWENMMIW